MSAIPLFNSSTFNGCSGGQNIPEADRDSAAPTAATVVPFACGGHCSHYRDCCKRCTCDSCSGLCPTIVVVVVVVRWRRRRRRWPGVEDVLKVGWIEEDVPDVLGFGRR